MNQTFFRCALLTGLLAATLNSSFSQQPVVDQTKPLPLSQPRPSAATIQGWKSRRFGMFIHFGLYSELGGVWQGKQIDNGYSEQIMANAPIPRDQYAKLASSFNPANFDADAIVALAKAAGMRFIVVTAKHHDGFSMFATKQSDFNIVEGTPYHKDVVKQLSEACARGGLKFGVYYSTIDWHAPTGSPYIEGNSNPISDDHAKFNRAQLTELLTGYGPLSEIWFDMGKPTPEQSQSFAQTVHRLQPATMVSGRVFNYQGDFTVMGDNEVPKFAIDEPWQTPASIYGETWGYRSWQKHGEVADKVHEKILELVTVVSGGGNYILNIGPKGDGSVVPFESQVLQGMGSWVKANGAAIFGSPNDVPGGSPFQNLNFGYATLGKTHLYLFVKSLPADGKLLLPGVAPGTHLGQPYLLGHERLRSGSVDLSPEGATVEVADLLKQASTEFLPVVVVPFTGSFNITPAQTIRPDSKGEMTLPPDKADSFFNYNGRGYEAPATLYKLRWWIASKPGTYQVAVHYNKVATAGTMTLLIGGQHRQVLLEAGSGEGVWTGDIPITAGSARTGGDQRVEVTPPEPFYKGTPLPVKIIAVSMSLKQ
ncbi:alpha-L-fucosidase [Granulicella arctica]|uniref:alpha-L-fucosidase n=1 Tax=Granulicella arctica TaxID=940613 RepID=UPI0021E0C313|nr:alpha-L-fucosidase [Granulicella arctica]